MKLNHLFALTFLAAPAFADLDEAMDAFRAGEYLRVIEIAGELPPETDDFRRGLYLSGEAQLLLHRAEDAERSFSGVLDLNPKATPALVGLGRSLLAQERPTEAEPHLRSALELEPSSAPARRALGEFLVQAERFEEADEVLTGLYAENPASPLVARALAESFLLTDRIESAMEVAESLVSRAPRHPMGHFLQGIVFERMGEEDAALEAYGFSLERDERFLDAHKNIAILAHTLSNTYQIQERNELALAHYARYFELGGEDAALEQAYTTMRQYLTGE